ncbi:hypothetical protein [Trinickia acidisoli]|uniref:hypothetical protein n=1 Tax=Trinickia acidisoli TaxID=2767482 RepID=UPI001A8FD807|nr:hypothetical protein [Trinickia acidisoli]
MYKRTGDAMDVARSGEYVDNHVERRGKCHENVAQWLQEHPLDRPVRGWLVDQSQWQNGFVEFHAHSVVALTGGGLMDVTLSASDRCYRFLSDERSDEEFLMHAREEPTLRHVVDQARYDAFRLAVDDSLLYGRFDAQG